MSRISISGIVVASLLTCGCATIPLPQKVPMADGADDAASKQFSPAPGKANIYVAKTSIVGSRYAVPVFLDGKAAGMVGLNSHLLLEVAPGKHVVMVVTPENQHSLAVSVGSGENRFFEVAAKMGTVYARAELRPLSESEGKQAVLQTRRASQLASDSPASQNLAPPGAGGTYTNSVFRWSISYPAGWRVEAENPHFVRLRRGSALAGIHTYADVAGRSLDQVASDDLRSWAQNLGNRYQEVSRKPLTLAGGLPALEVVHLIGTGAQGKSRKIIAVQGERRILIDAEAYLADWPNLEGDFDRIVESFQLRD
jgi:hypothetical protein